MVVTRMVKVAPGVLSLKVNWKFGAVMEPFAVYACELPFGEKTPESTGSCGDE